MSWKSLSGALLSFGLIACAGVTPRSSSTPTTSAAPADVVWFTGSSNIRRFTCSTTQVAVSAEAALAEFDRTRADGIPAVSSAALAIPIKSLDCGIHKMNHDLFATLGGDANPTISFVLSDYVVTNPQSPATVRINGLLRLAGRASSTVINGTVARAPDGQLRLRGEHRLDVRDFGVKPPRRFFGLLRVQPDIKIRFDVAVRPLIDPLGILTSTLQ
jgi:hypothetical protein